MDKETRDLRISSMMRGVFFGLLTAGYAILMPYPQASFKVSFAIGAALQLAILLMRKFAPAEAFPKVQYLLELVADGATVLLFALGVFGTIANMPQDL
jgi:hypothetical protein